MEIRLVKLKNRTFAFSQRLGKALMFPISVLPAAGIMVGIGHWMDSFGWGRGSFLSALLTAVGMIILDNIPILFAAGVALGMARERDGAAAMAGILAYLVITRMLSPESVAQFQGKALERVDPAFGYIGNQFTGILSGLVAAKTYNRFHQLQLPTGFSFFGGKRSVPLVSALLAVPISMGLYALWPILYNSLVDFGKGISNLGALGAGIYGFMNRLLLPLGLHHPLNSVFWFDVIGINDIGNFWSSQGTYGVTGRYQAGFFPVMMFGLPGAALAMAHAAYPGKKKQTRSFMLTSAFASFFTGITEPLEFSFMFAAPPLYVLHAALTGLSLYLSAKFQWIAGFGFSAGFTDFFLSIRMPFAKNLPMLLVLGIVLFFTYFLLFTAAIRKFNILTPGREKRREVDTSAAENLYTTNYRRFAKNLLKACGGAENIVSLDCCITRLRLEVKDSRLVHTKRITEMGVLGIREMDPDLQIIIGPQVAYILDEMQKLILGKG